MSGPEDYDDDPPMICPATRESCIRAFCDDYGCANKARIPIDEYDMAQGSIHPDELLLPMPRPPSKRTGKAAGR